MSSTLTMSTSEDLTSDTPTLSSSWTPYSRNKVKKQKKSYSSSYNNSSSGEKEINEENKGSNMFSSFFANNKKTLLIVGGVLLVLMLIYYYSYYYKVNLIAMNLCGKQGCPRCNNALSYVYSTHGPLTRISYVSNLYSTINECIFEERKKRVRFSEEKKKTKTKTKAKEEEE